MLVFSGGIFFPHRWVSNFLVEWSMDRESKDGFLSNIRVMFRWDSNNNIY